MKLLIIEDAESDYWLIRRQLRHSGLNADCHRVATSAELRGALARDDWDAVLSDYRVPGMDFKVNLDMIRAMHPNLPLLLVSGSIGEEAAVEFLKQGVCDFVLKDRLARLPQAIERSIREMRAQQARYAAENALRLSEERFNLALRGANDGVWDWDLRTQQLYFSSRWKSMLGYADDELEDCIQTWHSLMHPDDKATTLQKMQACIDGSAETFELEYKLRHKQGYFRHILSRGFLVRGTDGGARRVVGTHVDLTDLKAAHERIEYLAHHDPLTDLPNRVLLLDRLRQYISLAARSGAAVAVLFLDVDNFKHVNDSLGHAVGDGLLQEMGKRLKVLLRAGDTVARIGGDEFVVVLAEASSVENVMHVAQKIGDAVKQPFFAEGYKLQMTTSIGVSMFPRDGNDAPTLLKNADNAMYEAKEAGRSSYRFFSPDMDERVHQRFRTEADLRDALSRDEFRVFYQPQVNVQTGCVQRVEALLRWQHPVKGLLAPGSFLSVAEDTGLIVPIGAWVLDESCCQCRAWQQCGIDMVVSVNLSARQFQQADLLDMTQTTLEAYGLSGRSLELELTESLLVKPNEQVMAVLNGLRQLGIGLAVDDFGTGYSSLSYLKSYPINTLKIAQPFVDDVASSEDNLAIAEAVVALARAMHLQTVAEGVENRQQAQILRDIGADFLQGYHFSRPVPAEQLAVGDSAAYAV